MDDNVFFRQKSNLVVKLFSGITVRIAWVLLLVLELSKMLWKEEVEVAGV